MNVAIIVLLIPPTWPMCQAMPDKELHWYCHAYLRSLHPEVRSALHPCAWKYSFLSLRIGASIVVLFENEIWTSVYWVNVLCVCVSFNFKPSHLCIFSGTDMDSNTSLLDAKRYIVVLCDNAKGHDNLSITDQEEMWTYWSPHLPDYLPQLAQISPFPLLFLPSFNLSSYLFTPQSSSPPKFVSIFYRSF